MTITVNANLSMQDGRDFITDTKVFIPEEGTNEMTLSHTGPYSPHLDATYRTENATQWLTSGYNVTDGINRNDTEGFFERNAGLMKMEIALQGAILYMALFGNALVLIVLKLRHQKLSRMQWFMVHLALADLFVCFFNILPQLIWDITGEFHGNDFVCRSVTYFQVVAMFASSYVLIMCGVDRYMSICHPLTSQTLTPNRVHAMIAIAWSVSLLCAIPQIFIFSLEEREPGRYTCYANFVPGWGLKAYVTYMFMANYAIPLLILAFCYGRICHVVWARVASKDTGGYSTIRTSPQESSNKPFRLRISFRRMRDQPNSTTVAREAEDHNNSLIVPGQKPRGHQRGVSKSKVKTVKMTLTVVFCYLLCWAPFYIGNMASLYGNIDFEAPTMVAFMLLASLNSCTNPWIYLAFSGRICPRKQLRRTSKSWGPSTHLTSGGEAVDSRSRASFLDMSQTRPGLPVRQGSHRCAGSGQQSSNC